MIVPTSGGLLLLLLAFWRIPILGFKLLRLKLSRIFLPPQGSEGAPAPGDAVENLLLQENGFAAEDLVCVFQVLVLLITLSSLPHLCREMKEFWFGGLQSCRRSLRRWRRRFERQRLRILNRIRGRRRRSPGSPPPSPSPSSVGASAALLTILPQELIQEHILTFLDGQSLAKFQESSRASYQLGSADELLWRRLCEGWDGRFLGSMDASFRHPALESLRKRRRRQNDDSGRERERTEGRSDDGGEDDDGRDAEEKEQDDSTRNDHDLFWKSQFAHRFLQERHSPPDVGEDSDDDTEDFPLTEAELRWRRGFHHTVEQVFLTGTWRSTTLRAVLLALETLWLLAAVCTRVFLNLFSAVWNLTVVLGNLVSAVFSFLGEFMVWTMILILNSRRNRQDERDGRRRGGRRRREGGRRRREQERGGREWSERERQRRIIIEPLSG